MENSTTFKNTVAPVSYCRKLLGHIFRVLLIVVGAFLICDTMFVMTLSNINLGVVMPFIIGVPLFVCGVFFPLVCKLFKKHLFVKLLVYAMIFVYVAFTLIFCTTTTLILINAATPSNGADAIIVLGSGIRENSPTLTLKYRLDAAIEYLDDNPETVVVVSGGQGEDEIVSEASVMHDYLVRHGVSADRILMEDRSTSTEENFLFSMDILGEHLEDASKIVFVTTEFHVFRAERVAAKLGITAEGIPANGVWYITLNDYMRECAALVQYFLTGVI